MNLRGLYGIADTATLGAERFETAVEAALAGGATALQYRDKTEDRARRSRQAEALVAACRRWGALAIINDDPALAAASGADGVHLGGDDAAPAAVRARLGPDAVIGVSCYDRIERAHAARAAGADYVAFGRMYPSITKPGGPIAPMELLGRARAETRVPVCAIGGITAARAPALIAAGADLLAVIDDLFSAADIQAQAARYAAAFAAADLRRDGRNR